MKTTPLHPEFGVEIHDIDLTQVTADRGYPEIRAAFEAHSLLLFRGQSWADADILRFARLFGPVENRTDNPDHVPRVSNVEPDGRVLEPDAQRLKDLQANMLWHTDSTFLPVPALANIITARVVPSEGGATELVSTRAGLARLPDHLRALLRGGIRHRYAHSRARIDPELARAAHIVKWPDQIWRGLWTNPVNGRAAVYIASHACGIEGLSAADAQARIDEIIDRLTPPEAVYAHRWRVGDVLIWDERATLHRGMPWPYAEPRTLASVCVSAGAADGLESMRVSA